MWLVEGEKGCSFRYGDVEREHMKGSRGRREEDEVCCSDGGVCVGGGNAAPCIVVVVCWWRSGERKEGRDGVVGCSKTNSGVIFFFPLHSRRQLMDQNKIK